MSEREDAAIWLTVAQAAAALGVSERAVQKRAAAGKIGARRRETPQGVRWEIDANELTRTGSRTGEPTGRERPNEPPERTAQTPEPVAESAVGAASSHANRRTEQGANERTARTEPANQAPELMAHLMEENRFLRAALEARDRDAAELRAALREALRMSTRALPAPIEAGPDRMPQVLVGPGEGGATTGSAGAPERAPGAAECQSAQVLASGASGPQKAIREPRRGFRAWMLRMLRS